MIIYLKNKHTLEVDDFKFRCSIGKNGKSKKKKEGDKKTPIGYFEIEKNMGWCDNPFDLKNYNKLIKLNKKIKCEKLYRKDNIYDLIIPIKYNFLRPVKLKGSCIFIHLTNNYKPTLGCIAIKKRDFLIILKLINKKTKIKII